MPIYFLLSTRVLLSAGPSIEPTSQSLLREGLPFYNALNNDLPDHIDRALRQTIAAIEARL